MIELELLKQVNERLILVFTKALKNLELAFSKNKLKLNSKGKLLLTAHPDTGRLFFLMLTISLSVLA